jgi:TRAP-type C4-dicarboxylate transport system substrate-binding protein
MIDGQVNPVFAIEEMSFYEVTDYLIFANHAQFVTSVVSNPDFFAALAPVRQTMVRETVSELNDYIFAVQEAFNAERLEAIKRRKPEIEIIRLDEHERERFRRASLPVRDKYVEMVGPRGAVILEQLLEEIARAEIRASGPS